MIGATQRERPALLLLFQEGIEVLRHFRAGPVLAANDFAVDVARAVDDVGVGEHRGAIIGGDLARGVARSGEAHVVSLQEIVIGGLVVVDADAKDRAAKRRDLLLQLIQRRRFVDARRAPGGPEIQHDDAASQVRKVRRLAIERESEILCGLAVEARFALAIVGMSEYSQKARDENEREASFEFSF